MLSHIQPSLATLPWHKNFFGGKRIDFVLADVVFPSFAFFVFFGFCVSELLVTFEDIGSAKKSQKPPDDVTTILLISQPISISVLEMAPREIAEAKPAERKFVKRKLA